MHRPPEQDQSNSYNDLIKKYDLLSVEACFDPTDNRRIHGHDRDALDHTIHPEKT